MSIAEFLSSGTDRTEEESGFPSDEEAIETLSAMGVTGTEAARIVTAAHSGGADVERELLQVMDKGEALITFNDQSGPIGYNFGFLGRGRYGGVHKVFQIQGGMGRIVAAKVCELSDTTGDIDATLDVLTGKPLGIASTTDVAANSSADDSADARIALFEGEVGSLRSVRDSTAQQTPQLAADTRVVVPMFVDSGIRFTDGRPFYLMEYRPGWSLSSLQRPSEEGGVVPLPEDFVLDLLFVQLQQLRHVHEVLGGTHQDLKPDNFKLNARGAVSPLDFGFARATSSFTFDPTDKSGSAGTPQFMAPETFNGRATHLSDLYSLASSAYFLATGRQAVPGETISDIYHAHLAGHTTDVSNIRNPALRSVLGTLLQHDSDRRGGNSAKGAVTKASRTLFGHSSFYTRYPSVDDCLDAPLSELTLPLSIDPDATPAEALNAIQMAYPERAAILRTAKSVRRRINNEYQLSTGLVSIAIVLGVMLYIFTSEDEDGPVVPRPVAMRTLKSAEQAQPPLIYTITDGDQIQGIKFFDVEIPGRSIVTLLGEQGDSVGAMFSLSPRSVRNLLNMPESADLPRGYSSKGGKRCIQYNGSDGSQLTWIAGNLRSGAGSTFVISHQGETTVYTDDVHLSAALSTADCSVHMHNDAYSNPLFAQILHDSSDATDHVGDLPTQGKNFVSTFNSTKPILLGHVPVTTAIQ